MIGLYSKNRRAASCVFCGPAVVGSKNISRANVDSRVRSENLFAMGVDVAPPLRGFCLPALEKTNRHKKDSGAEEAESF